jgi:nitroreductase
VCLAGGRSQQPADYLRHLAHGRRRCAVRLRPLPQPHKLALVSRLVELARAHTILSYVTPGFGGVTTTHNTTAAAAATTAAASVLAVGAALGTPLPHAVAFLAGCAAVPASFAEAFAVGQREHRGLARFVCSARLAAAGGGGGNGAQPDKLVGELGTDRRHRC